MCSFGNQGDSMFVTYRDPNLTETYDVYDHAAQFVEEFDADERDMKKYIIGTISNMDMPMGPDDMGARSFNAYLMGRTEEELQKDRDQVLGCTRDDIRALAPLVKAVVKRKDSYGTRIQIRICNIDRAPQCGKINADEPADRTEDRHYIQQTADHEKPDPHGIYR